MDRQQPPQDRSIFGELMQGLHDSLAHARGELTLRTTTLPAPPPPTSRASLVRLRKRMGMSQAVFAAWLNVSKKTIQAWEQGTRVPKAGEARLLQVFEAAPSDFKTIVFGRSSKASRQVPPSRVQKRRVRPGTSSRPSRRAPS